MTFSDINYRSYFFKSKFKFILLFELIFQTFVRKVELITIQVILLKQEITCSVLIYMNKLRLQVAVPYLKIEIETWSLKFNWKSFIKNILHLSLCRIRYQSSLTDMVIKNSNFKLINFDICLYSIWNFLKSLYFV